MSVAVSSTVWRLSTRFVLRDPVPHDDSLPERGPEEDTAGGGGADSEGFMGPWLTSPVPEFGAHPP